jgi:thiol-disulfide isomerase/thioredoxin
VRSGVAGRGLTSFFGAALALVLAAGGLPAAEINTPAPRVTVATTRGQRRLLAEYKGKVVFLNFWASWCGPCAVELPQLNRLAASYKGKKVRVLAINVDKNRAAAKRLLAKLGLTAPAFELFWDTQSKAVSAFDAQTMPSSYVLDPRGIVRYVHSGYKPQDPAAWRREINQCLKE